MKKKLLCLLLIMPIIINAKECNYDEHEKYTSNSNLITYDNDYSISSSKFNLKIYNISDGLYVKCNERTYYPDNNNIVYINNISEGTSLSIYVMANDGCTSPVKSILFKEPYKNEYYGSKLCEGYEKILTMCSSKYTSYEVTQEMLEDSIYNYEKTIPKKTEKTEEVEEDKTVIEIVKEVVTNYGIKISLFLFSTFISLLFYSSKVRKLKHGI